MASLVYGAADPKAGAVQTLYQLLSDPRLNHRVQTVSGVLMAECGADLDPLLSAAAPAGQEVTRPRTACHGLSESAEIGAVCQFCKRTLGMLP